MIRRDIFAVKNGNTYEFMTTFRRYANNRMEVAKDSNLRLGLTAEVKLVHPSQKAVELYILANGPLDDRTFQVA